MSISILLTIKSGTVCELGLDIIAKPAIDALSRKGLTWV